MLETNNRPVVRYADDVVDCLNELIDTLFQEDYFGFIDSAKQYVLDMKNYIERNISILPKYPAPSYFSRYQTDAYYVTYKSNKYTTWYIFFFAGRKPLFDLLYYQ